MTWFNFSLSIILFFLFQCVSATVCYDKGVGVTNNQFRQFKREVRKMLKDSESFKSVFNDLKNDSFVYTFKVESNCDGGHYDDKEKMIKIGINSDNGTGKRYTMIGLIAHESGHAWRSLYKLDPEWPEKPIVSIFLSSEKLKLNLNEYIDMFVNVHEISERGASHIENIIRSELMKSNNYPELNLKEFYTTGLRSITTVDDRMRLNRTFDSVYYNVLSFYNKDFYIQGKINIYTEHNISLINKTH
jgi:hypothetical protein